MGEALNAEWLWIRGKGMVVHLLGRVSDKARYRIYILDQSSRAVVGKKQEIRFKS